MIISMPTIARSQQLYDHRLRNLVQRNGDVTVATDLGVPRSTAELSIRTFWTLLRELSSRRRRLSIVREEFSPV
jgi:hypothetical protein